MLEAAVGLVFPGARTAAVCEWEAYAASVHLARMADQSVEPYPIWCGDLGGLDARPFLGVVDILCGGLPCQPYSPAGKRRGNEDERSWGTTASRDACATIGNGSGPLPHTLRIIGECRPAVVWFENVPAWVRGGWFRDFGDALSGMGYTIVDPVFIAASDVGASHERERVFVLAYAADDARCAVLADAYDQPGAEPGRGGEDLAVAGQPGREGGERGEPSGGGDGKEAHGSTGEFCGIFAPGPGDFDGWGRVVADGSYDHRAPATKPGVRVLVDGDALVVDASRTDQLRCAGNAVVALQAAVALVESLRRMREMIDAQGH
jgi:site-specific DNA-cytosine methylase